MQVYERTENSIFGAIRFEPLTSWPDKMLSLASLTDYKKPIFPSQLYPSCTQIFMYLFVLLR